MRHSWLVLATLLVCMGEADAKRVSCACPRAITLPELAATDVPTNAKIWQVGDNGAVHYSWHTASADLVGVRAFAPNLLPNAEFHDETFGVDFVTSGLPDTTPPAAPRSVSMSLVTVYEESDFMPRVVSLAAFGSYDDETALVRIDITDRDGVVSLLTTPRRLYLCEPGFMLSAGIVKVEVRSIDIAGNESAPFTTMVDVTRALHADHACGDHDFATVDRHHHHHRGHGFEILLLVLIIPGLLISWLVIVIVRRVTVKRHLAEPISLLVAEEVARRLVRWQIVWSVMLVAATLGVVRGIDEQYWIFLAPWLFSSFGQLFMQHRALRLLDRPETDAARRGPWLVVTTLRDSVTVRASDSDFVVAKRRSIPKSVLQ
jgi:hypothetical protein